MPSHREQAGGLRDRRGVLFRRLTALLRSDVDPEGYARELGDITTDLLELVDDALLELERKAATP